MRREWAILVLLALATFAVYFHALNQQFVNYDDPIYITLNAHLRDGLTWSSFSWAMSSWYANFYHPLTWLSHLLDVSLFDLKPQGHKLTNLLLHLANTLLVFAWLRTMTGAVVRSAIVAALFSLHPLHVESVVWVSQRKDLLSTLFLLLTLITYTHYTRRPNPAGYLLVTLCLLLGLLAKPMLVTLPAVMLLLDVWPLNRGDDRKRWRRLIVEKLPWFALAAVFSIIAYLAQRRGEALASTEMFPLSARLANAVVSYARYLGRMFYPANLAPSYPHPYHWPATTVIGAVLLLIAITLIAWWTHKRKTYLLVGWLWFLGTLVPVIGLVQVGSHAMADRYTYVSLLGPFIALTWLACDLTPERVAMRRGMMLAALLLLTALSIVSWRQVRHWDNSVSLFEHTLRVTGDQNSTAHHNLAVALAAGGEFSKAVSHYQRAISLGPARAERHYNLASALDRLGRIEEAVEHFKIALDKKPQFPEAHYSLGATLARRGDVAGAMEHYRQAIAQRDSFSPAHLNLADLLAHQKQFDQAITHYNLALHHDRDWPPAMNNLAWFIVTHPQATVPDHDAVALAQRACERTSWSNPSYLDTLAAAHAMRGEFELAVDVMKAAILLAHKHEPQLLPTLERHLRLYESRRTLTDAD